MNMLMHSSGVSPTMTSSDLCELVNSARIEFGENEVRRNDFTARCKDELDGEHYETFVVGNPNGTTSEVIRLTQDQCLLISMRESKAVRRRVVDQLKRISPSSAIPNFSNPAEAARAWALEYEARVYAEATKAEIGARREATAMNTASQAVKKAQKLEIELDRSKEYATVKRMEMLYHGTSFNWRLLKSTAAEMGVPAIDVFDANYGTVKSYHASVWKEAYAVSID